MEVPKKSRPQLRELLDNIVPQGDAMGAPSANDNNHTSDSDSSYSDSDSSGDGPALTRGQAYATAKMLSQAKGRVAAKMMVRSGMRCPITFAPLIPLSSVKD